MIIVHREGTADCSRKNGHTKFLNYQENWIQPNMKIRDLVVVKLRRRT
uniref:Uncharacterized protein n=1 Tax=Zea mays TaxID=4577 RepID=C4J2G9_MAIZE|nr:unknown [Zea mays]